MVEWEENKEGDESHGGWCHRRQRKTSKEQVGDCTNSKCPLDWARPRYW